MVVSVPSLGGSLVGNVWQLLSWAWPPADSRVSRGCRPPVGYLLPSCHLDVGALWVVMGRSLPIRAAGTCPCFRVLTSYTWL